MYIRNYLLKREDKMRQWLYKHMNNLKNGTSYNISTC
jgi:hypothetical protein